MPTETRHRSGCVKKANQAWSERRYIRTASELGEEEFDKRGMVQLLHLAIILFLHSQIVSISQDQKSPILGEG